MRNSKSKILLVITLIFTLCLGTAMQSFAATASDKLKEADKVEKKKEAAQESMEEMEQRYNQISKDIKTTKKEIKETKIKIEKKQKEVDEQETALGDRLTAMYKTGTVGYVDVILSSQGISDLISNIGMVQQILENDQDILKGLKDDLKEIKEMKEKLIQKQKDLKVNQEEAAALRDKYKKEYEKYKKQEDQLRAEAEALAGEVNPGAGDGKYQPTDFGTYCWPTPANWFYTSYYGWRIHPILGYKKYHSGYDICLTSGTNGAPVYAVGNGYVTKASWYGGYGNCVMINIGHGYTTLYGHLSGYACSYGQTVKKGQVVGYIGSTGMSTGPHLHFSLYKDGVLVDPLLLYK